MNLDFNSYNTGLLDFREVEEIYFVLFFHSPKELFIINWCVYQSLQGI